MNSYRGLIVALLASFALVAYGTESLAQTPIAGDDFDGGTSNGGLTPLTRRFTPDSTDGPGDADCNGLFAANFGCGGSRWDRFGILNRDADDVNGEEGLLFEMVDQTVLGARGQELPNYPDYPDPIPGDDLGILRSTKLDNVVGFVDTVNGDNPDSDGRVTADWTFDISGSTNLQISMDFAAAGDFDNPGTYSTFGDFFKFTYSIDGDTSQTAFDVRPDDDGSGFDSGIFYTVTMENGMTYDRYVFSFFDENEWDTLIANGPGSGLDYHPDDVGTEGDANADGDVDGADFLQFQRNGTIPAEWEANFGTTGGDKVAQDGFISPLTGAFGTFDQRALTSLYPDVEHVAYRDPLFVNGNAGVGTPLDNEFQTITVPITGVGNTLTLELEAIADGSTELFMFDNILIEGDPPAISPVPEPASIGLFGLGLGLISPAMRRRRQS